MKSILSTCILLLVLPWTLVSETTPKSSTNKGQEDTSEDYKNTSTTETTILSGKTTEFPLKPSSTKQHEDIPKYNETTISGDELTTVTPKSGVLHVKSSTAKQNITTLRSNKTTILAQISTRHLLETRSTKQNEYTSKYHELSLRPNSTVQQEVTPKDHETALSSKSPPQTIERKHDTSMSHAKYLTSATTMSAGESSSPLVLLTQKTTGRITITPLLQSKSKEVSVTRDDQTLNHLKSTNKGAEIHTEGKKTTRSAEKEADGSTPFQKTPEVTTNQPPQEVQTTATMSTKWSSLPQEKASTHTPKFYDTNSDSTLDSSTTMNEEKRTDSVTYRLGTSTITSFSTGSNYIADTMDTKTTNKTTTKNMINETKPPTLTNTPPSTETEIIKSITSPAPIKGNNNPGHIVASLIGCILLLMLLAFVVIFVRNHQNKKKQMEDTEWAGPSPFIDGEINPNQPTINEDGAFLRQESKRISLHSFLPKRFSKRLSMLSPLDEEVPLENTQAGSTFGQQHLQPLNGQATPPNQIQIHEANSPPAEVSSNSNVPETESVPPSPENNEDIKTTTKLDDTIVQSPPEETNGVDPTAFEDVDLNVSPDKNAESPPSPPTDAINIPTPPPLAPF